MESVLFIDILKYIYLSIVFFYDGSQFHPAFDHVGSIPTTASVGGSASFNITKIEDAIYLFGGQEDWRNSEDEKWEDPKINFNNRLFRLDLKKGSWKEVNFKRLSGSNVVNMPSPRSQSFSFIRNEQLYVYGGYDGLNIFSDLYKLDLSTLEWCLIETNNLVGPREFTGKYFNKND